MGFSEPWAPWEKKVTEDAAVVAAYLDVPAWRGRRLAAVEALEVQMIVRGSQ
jgi:hypothetical protein